MAALLLMCLAIPFARSTTLAEQASFATYQPRPYTINVNKELIRDAQHRALTFRPTHDIDAPQWFDGPPSANVTQVADYWAHHFNFSQFQHEINHNFSHYMTTVPPPGGSYNRSLDIHFIHQKSNRTDAIPMLLLHGWPSTSLEWAQVIPGLTNPSDSSLPAFHAIAPDLPGYGFSPAPTTTGLGAEEQATVFDNLMQQLGYDRYILYSTDLGFAIAKRLVNEYTEKIINHVTDFYIVPPNATDQARFASGQTTPEETAYISSLNAYGANHSAYAAVSQTFPLSLAHAMNDSPVGFLAWIWQLVYTVDDRINTAEDLIRRTLLLYIPGPYGNVRSYKELFPDIFGFNGRKTIVPTSVLQFGGIHAYPDLANFNYVPLEWIERFANVTYFKRQPVGGHFPAQSQPQLWLDEVRQVFAKTA